MLLGILGRSFLGNLVTGIGAIGRSQGIIYVKIKGWKDKINLDEQESIEIHCIDLYVNDNNVIYFKFLLAGDGFMPDIHLRQPGFTCSACGSFTKNKERKTIIKKQKIRVIFVKTNQIKPVSKMG